MDQAHKQKIVESLSVLCSSVINFPGLKSEAARQQLIPQRLLDNLEKIPGSRENSIENFFLAVLKRGPKAYNILLNCLRASNNVIAYNILSGVDKEPRISQSHIAELPVKYPITSSPKGNILIVNNKDYGTFNSVREGSEYDVQRLENLFSTLDFRITTLLNLTRQQLDQALNSFAAREDHSDVCIVFIGSHGKLMDSRESVQCCDGQFISVPAIWSKFNNKNCPRLCGKPKIFIFQMCRGRKMNKIVPPSRTKSDGKPSNTKVGLKVNDLGVPSVTDIFCLFSSVYGFRVSPGEKSGSPMVKHFCNVVENFGNDSLDDIVDKVSQLCRRIDDSINPTMPSVEKMGFDRQFYFTA